MILQDTGRGPNRRLICEDNVGVSLSFAPPPGTFIIVATVILTMPEWQCPKCSLVIDVPHPNTLALDVAMHKKKHEIRGY